MNLNKIKNSKNPVFVAVLSLLILISSLLTPVYLYDTFPINWLLAIIITVGGTIIALAFSVRSVLLLKKNFHGFWRIAVSTVFNAATMFIGLFVLSLMSANFMATTIGFFNYRSAVKDCGHGPVLLGRGWKGSSHYYMPDSEEYAGYRYSLDSEPLIALAPDFSDKIHKYVCSESEAIELRYDKVD